MKNIGLVPFAFAAGLLVVPAAFTAPAHAQSADLVLCDRVAADPADPDKPADVQGTSAIAKQDVATAIKFCRTASGASRRALYQLGRAQAANGQTAEALATWRKAVDKGSSAAMVELGVAYGTGNGVARDADAARKLFERAAAAGNPRGVSNLAAVSGGGAGPSANPAQARAQLAKAADANVAEAQFQLGQMMADGEGGPKDEAGARALFEKAAAQNHPEALVWAGSYAQRGVGGPEDTAKAKDYFTRAAALGNEEAKAALKRIECPYVLKDKRGQVMTNLCF
jgi:TPR repeat protein